MLAFRRKPFWVGVLSLLLVASFVALALALANHDARTRIGVWAFNRGLDTLAAMLFDEPARAGFAPAQNHLAVLRFDGLGTGRIRQDTITYLKAAAAAGYAPAQVNLGMLYWRGVSARLERDKLKARDLYEASAAQGDPFGLSKLARAIMSTGARGRYHKIVPLLREAARSGDPEMLYAFAHHLHFICANEADEPSCQRERIDAFRQAAAQGHPAAQLELAKLLELAAARPELVSLAELYDPEEFMRLIRSSAESGYVLGQSALARAYFKGEGVSRNRAEAARWFEKVAAYRKAARPEAPPRGYQALYLRPHRSSRPGVFKTPARAQLRLGDIYAEGIDVTQRFETAARYYRLAAKQNLKEAGVKLAKLFLEGRGVPEDREEAIYWLEKARQAGSDEAALLLVELDSN